MYRIPVESSNITSVGYDASTMTLEIEFHHGGVYQYFDVPQSTYDLFLAADSKGTFFHIHIKNNFRYAQL